MLDTRPGVRASVIPDFIPGYSGLFRLSVVVDWLVQPDFSVSDFKIKSASWIGAGPGLELDI